MAPRSPLSRSFLAARLAFAYALGPGIDESYTLAIARTLSLSYFDHPPLHQWIAHFAARAFGEGLGARTPFIALFAATGWILYRLTLDLFGARAGLIAVFALNATPFFFASAGTWIVPDGPLLFGLAAAVWALGRLFFSEPASRSAIWLLWLAAGAGIGVAGLSKYSAALSVAGLLAFVVLAKGRRRWLRDPAPYAAAALALAMTVPVLVWNAEHGWASFVFQGARGAPGPGLKPAQFLLMALGEIVYLLPWIFAILVASIGGSVARPGGRAEILFLLPRPAADRPVHPDAACGALAACRNGRCRAGSSPILCWAPGSTNARSDGALRRWAVVSGGNARRRRGPVRRAGRDRLPLAILAAALEGRRSDAGGLRLARLARRAAVQAPARLRAVDALVGRRKDRARARARRARLRDVRRSSRLGLCRGRRSAHRTRRPSRRASRRGFLARAAAALCFREVGPTRFTTLARNGAVAVTLALVPVHGLTRRLPLPYPGAPGG